MILRLRQQEIAHTVVGRQRSQQIAALFPVSCFECQHGFVKVFPLFVCRPTPAFRRQQFKHSDGVIKTDRLKSTHSAAASFCAVKLVPSGGGRWLIQQNRCLQVFCKPLQSRCRIHNGAEDTNLGVMVRSNLTCNRRPTGDPNPDAQAAHRVIRIIGGQCENSSHQHRQARTAAFGHATGHPQKPKALSP